MQKKILFVDDDPTVLRGFERMLRPLREEWACVFTSHTRDALEMLRTEHVDAIVSDMRMPGMDGAEFLAQAMAQHPGSARLVLSGQAHRGSLVRLIGVAHQCLAKPCQADSLTAVLRRTLRPHQCPTLTPLRESILRLSVPSGAERLRTAVTEAGTHGDAAARDSHILATLERDPILACKMLQVSTWVHMDAARPVTTLREAIRLSAHDFIVEWLPTSPGADAPHAVTGSAERQAEEECALTGRLAQAIARAEGWTDSAVADAGMIGLLSGLGAVLLSISDSERYEAVRAQAARGPVSASDLERDHFGLTGMEAAVYLCELWGISESIVEAIASTERHLGARLDTLGSAGVARVARALVRDRNGGLDALDLEQLGRMRLLHRLPVWQALAPEDMTRTR